MSTYLLMDPHETLDYSHQWDDFLAEGDTIALRLWTISPMNPGSPATPTLVGETMPSVFVSGLLPGRVYRLTERITTAAGIVADRSVVLRCEEQ